MKIKVVIVIIASLVLNISGALFYAFYNEIELWKSVSIYFVALISFMTIVAVVLSSLKNKFKTYILHLVFLLIFIANVIVAYLFFT